jgi:Spy/CpxP family protein refolding chaperone
MRTIGGLSVGALAMLAGTALAQQPPAQRPTPPESAQAWRPRFQPEMQNRERVMRFQQQIEERWGRAVQNELNLNDQQMDRLRTASRANQDRQRELNQREEDLHRAVAGQLQPGVAANQDSLGRLMDNLFQARIGHVQSDQQFNRDLAAFLTPVQRARLFLMMRRFEQRVDQIRERQPGMPGPPGQAPMAPRMRRQPPGGPPQEQ